MDTGSAERQVRRMAGTSGATNVKTLQEALLVLHQQHMDQEQEHGGYGAAMPMEE